MGLGVVKIKNLFPGITDDEANDILGVEFDFNIPFKLDSMDPSSGRPRIGNDSFPAKLDEILKVLNENQGLMRIIIWKKNNDYIVSKLYKAGAASQCMGLVKFTESQGGRCEFKLTSRQQRVHLLSTGKFKSQFGMPFTQGATQVAWRMEHADESEEFKHWPDDPFTALFTHVEMYGTKGLVQRIHPETEK